MDYTGVAQEYVGGRFRDGRLTKRVVRMAARIAAAPAASFPTSLPESELEGAYRFFGNRKVDAASILLPHLEQTLRRRGNDEITLAVHDTTTLSFRNEGQREGFGSLTGESQHLWTHATLAVKADGSRCPFGLLALSTEAEFRHERWLEHVDQANQRVGKSDRLVHLMDREADDYAFFSRLVANGSRFVIRLKHDRRVESSHDDVATISEELSHAALVVERDVMLNARGTNKGSKAKKTHPARSARAAQLSVAGGPVTVRSPVGKKGVPSTLNLHAVHVWEESPPPGEPAVEWLLITTEPVTALDDLLRVVDWYRARWIIEEFFKALKTGCSIEKRQLESFHSFSNAVAFFVPMAWHLLLLRHRAKHDADGDGASSLPDSMLDVLRHIARKPLPPQPSARDVLFAVAALGGHLKRNGDPGWQTLGRGYDKLREAAEIWALAVRVMRSDQS